MQSSRSVDEYDPAPFHKFFDEVSDYDYVCLCIPIMRISYNALLETYYHDHVYHC